MVDALREIHRVLAKGGILIDARPDSRVLAYAERQKSRGFERFGVIRTNRTELTTDAAADGAVSQIVRERLFAHGRSGRFWLRMPFDSLAALREYLRDHLRFVHRTDWTVDVPTRRRHAKEPFVIRRAVRYEILEVLP